MKYIKTFENKIKPDDWRLSIGTPTQNTEKKLKTGDYVYVIDNYRNIDNNVGIIIRCYMIKQSSNRKYKISFIHDELTFYKDQLRLATPEEIEKYKLEKNANKYNL